MRIVQADDGALGPGRKEEQQDWYAPSAHEALVQPVRPGSRAVSGPLARLAGATSVALEVIFRPSLIDDHGDRLVAGLAARDGLYIERDIDPHRPGTAGALWPSVSVPAVTPSCWWARSWSAGEKRTTRLRHQLHSRCGRGVGTAPGR